MKKPKRAEKLSSTRAMLRVYVATLTKLADETAAHGATIPAEREKLRASRDRLHSHVKELTGIFDAHDAVLAGAPWTKPFNTSGPVLLSMALHEAFTISKFVTRNPITHRLRTLDATQMKVAASKTIDDLVASELARVLSEHPTRRPNARQIANEMREPLNAKLVARGLKELAAEAIRKRIGRRRKLGTVVDRPKKYGTNVDRPKTP